MLGLRMEWIVRPNIGPPALGSAGTRQPFEALRAVLILKSAMRPTQRAADEVRRARVGDRDRALGLDGGHRDRVERGEGVRARDADRPSENRSPPNAHG